MITISTRRLRMDLCRVLERVRKRKESFTILNHSTPVALLIPLGGNASAGTEPKRKALRGLTEAQAIIAAIAEPVEPREPDSLPPEPSGLPEKPEDPGEAFSRDGDTEPDSVSPGACVSLTGSLGERIPLPEARCGVCEDVLGPGLHLTIAGQRFHLDCAVRLAGAMKTAPG
jgi:antitoxin (DNA-binding transcriptional repressor) of toxin-antitoxin stability system